MADKHNIFDQAIREGFEKFHPEPPAGVWEGIAQGIGSQAAGATALTKAGAFGLKKLMIYFSAAAVLGTSGYFLLPENNKNKEQNSKPATETVAASSTETSPSIVVDETINNKESGKENKSVAAPATGWTIYPPLSAKQIVYPTPGKTSQGSENNSVASNTGNPEVNIQPQNNIPADNQVVVKEKASEQTGKEIFKTDNTSIVLREDQVCKGSEISFMVMLPEGSKNAQIQYGSGNAMARKAVNNKEYIYLTAEEAGTLTLILNWNAADGKAYMAEREIRVHDHDCELLINDLKNGMYQLDVHAESGNPEKIKWYLGDGEVEYGNNIIHQYINLEPARYTVAVVTYDENGCKDSITRNLENKYTADNLRPVIPNVFTPNGDGKNDQLEILINNEENYYLQVFDKDGRQVFESRDKNYKWNGRYMNEGEPCAGGTYMYVFNYKIKGDTESRQKKSMVSLIR